MTEPFVTCGTFTIERTYDEAPAQVFNAHADPAIKRRWLVEGEGFEVDEFTSDFRVGGLETSRFRFQGGEPMRTDTVYQDIVQDRRIGDDRVQARWVRHTSCLHGIRRLP